MAADNDLFQASRSVQGLDVGSIYADYRHGVAESERYARPRLDCSLGKHQGRKGAQSLGRKVQREALPFEICFPVARAVYSINLIPFAEGRRAADQGQDSFAALGVHCAHLELHGGAVSGEAEYDITHFPAALEASGRGLFIGNLAVGGKKRTRGDCSSRAVHFFKGLLNAAGGQKQRSNRKQGNDISFHIQFYFLFIVVVTFTLVPAGMVYS